MEVVDAARQPGLPCLNRVALRSPRGRFQTPALSATLPSRAGNPSSAPFDVIHNETEISLGIYRQEFGIYRQTPGYPLESTVTELILESNNLRIARAVDSKLRRQRPVVTV